MNLEPLAGIACGPWGQLQRRALVALHLGAAREADDFVPRLWDRKNKALAALEELELAGVVSRDGGRWYVVESKLAALADEGARERAQGDLPEVLGHTDGPGLGRALAEGERGALWQSVEACLQNPAVLEARDGLNRPELRAAGDASRPSESNASAVRPATPAGAGGRGFDRGLSEVVVARLRLLARPGEWEAFGGQWILLAERDPGYVENRLLHWLEVRRRTLAKSGQEIESALAYLSHVARAEKRWPEKVGLPNRALAGPGLARPTPA